MSICKTKGCWMKGRDHFPPCQIYGFNAVPTPKDDPYTFSIDGSKATITLDGVDLPNQDANSLSGDAGGYWIDPADPTVIHESLPITGKGQYLKWKMADIQRNGVNVCTTADCELCSGCDDPTVTTGEILTAAGKAEIAADRAAVPPVPALTMDQWKRHENELIDAADTLIQQVEGTLAAMACYGERAAGPVGDCLRAVLDFMRLPRHARPEAAQADGWKLGTVKPSSENATDAYRTYKAPSLDGLTWAMSTEKSAIAGLNPEVLTCTDPHIRKLVIQRGCHRCHCAIIWSKYDGHTDAVAACTTGNCPSRNIPVNSALFDEVYNQAMIRRLVPPLFADEADLKRSVEAAIARGEPFVAKVPFGAYTKFFCPVCLETIGIRGDTITHDCKGAPPF